MTPKMVRIPTPSELIEEARREEALIERVVAMLREKFEAEAEDQEWVIRAVVGRFRTSKWHCEVTTTGFADPEGPIAILRVRQPVPGDDAVSCPIAIFSPERIDHKPKRSKP